MKKRAQITAFVVIGLIIVASMTAFYFARARTESVKLESQASEQLEFESDISAVKMYVQGCIDKAAESSVDFLGAMGSNFDSPGGFFVREGLPISYLHASSSSYLPSIADWEDSLSVLFAMSMQVCDLSVFEKQGVFVQAGYPLADVKIANNNVKYNINFPIKVSTDFSKNELSVFTSSIPVRLGYMHKVAKEIIKDEINNPGYIPFTQILSYDLNVTVVNYVDENSVMYVIRDEEKQGIKPYFFVFMDKYELIDDDEKIVF